jgi:uncharacterized repeat protein (TIGR01451 family)
MGGGGTLSGSLVTWAVPSLAAGASITLSLQVQVSPTAAVPQDWLNAALASGSSPGLGAESSPVLFRVRNNSLSLRKSVRPTQAITGDEVTYSLLVENYTALTQSSLVLQEQIPSGFSVHGANPGLSADTQWNLTPLAPGAVASFSLWGGAFGIDGQVMVNTASLYQGASLMAQDSASLLLHKPIEPQVTLKAVYPNPAPSANVAFGEAVHIVYELNQAMPLTLDIYTVAGEKLYSRGVDGSSGLHEAVWDLRNDYGNGVASGLYAFRIWSSAAVKPTPEAFGYFAVLR